MPFDEPFTVVEERKEPRLFDEFRDLLSAKTADHDVQYVAVLRERFPDLIVTAVPATYTNLLQFAGSGHATAALDSDAEPVASWRSWVPSLRDRNKGIIGETVFFARYRYSWGEEDFLLYTVGGLQYILKEPRNGESVTSISKVTDDLITAVGTWQFADQNVVWVFDGYWAQNKDLWEQVQHAEWDKVILDEDLKKDLTSVSTKFFESMFMPWWSLPRCSY